MSRPKKLNILLVKPYQVANEVQPPLGLGYLASAVRDRHNVRILDCIKDDIKEKEFKKFLENKKFDIIGFQCYTVDLRTVKKLVDITREILPNSTIFVGGPQPTLDPINTLRYFKHADYILIGEGEVSFPIIIEYLSKGTLTTENLKKTPGIAYRIGKDYKRNQVVFPENLDQYDPCWDLYDLKSYPNAPHGAFCRQSPTMPLIITRGCPFQCTYCGGPIISGRKIRSHTVEYVIRQIEILNEEYGIKEIHVEDDNFTMNRNFIENFCKELIKKNLGITWTCPNGVRVDTLDEELLALMKRSGLYSISIGIESGSDRIRKLMKKNLNTRTIVEKVNMVHKAGIGVIGFFIVGYPGETKEDIEKTIKFACSLPLKRAAFSAFKPFPGTEIYNELIKNNKIKKLDWDNFSLDKVVWSPEGISHQGLKNLRREAFLRFYLRPKILFGMLAEVNNQENLKFILRRIYRWMS